jgi:uncharacterized protein (TIGR02270 family)
MDEDNGRPAQRDLVSIPEVVEQHAEEAAFLWSLRDAATDQPHFTCRHVSRLEQRVEAHLDGLRVGGGAGIKIALAQFEKYRAPAELFPLAVLALEDRREASIERVLEFAEREPESWRGLFGALGWVSADVLRGRAMAWLDGDTAFRRLLGVVACSLHRVDPGSRLDRLLGDEPVVRRRALRLAGELGRVDLSNHLRPMLSAEDDGGRFWAAWSEGLLGERQAAVPVLQAFATSESPFKWRALDLVVRLMDRESAIAWLRELAQDGAHARLVVIGVGTLGDPTVVPWLVERMNHPALARVAGESFSMIAGVDFSEEHLDRAPPDGFSAGPTDEPSDENIDIDQDENLSWPDTEKVQAWWQREGSRFTLGIRHLRGAPLTTKNCNGVWRDGYQRQRRAAAYEIALACPGSRLWNWRARALMQLDSLHSSALNH